MPENNNSNEDDSKISFENQKLIYELNEKIKKLTLENTKLKTINNHYYDLFVNFPLPVHLAKIDKNSNLSIEVTNIPVDTQAEKKPYSQNFSETILKFVKHGFESINTAIENTQSFEYTADIDNQNRNFRQIVYKGALEGYSCSVMVDITDEKRAVNALRNLEKQYKLIVENSNEAIIIVQNQKVIFSNAKASEIAGYTETEFKGSNYLDFIAPDQRSTIAENYIRRLKGLETPNFYNIKIRKKDGSDLWLELKVAYIIWDGKPATLNFFVDNREKIKAENQLRESEERYRSLIEASPVPILVHSNGNLVFLNNSALKSYGASSLDELIGRKMIDFVHPDYQSIISERVRRIYQKIEDSSLLEIQLKRIDGSYFYVEIMGSMINFNGEPASQVIFWDISDRVLAETIRSAIYDISEAAFLSEDLDSLFESVHQIINRLMPAKNFYIALYDKVDNLISFPYYTDEKEDGGIKQKIGFEKIEKSLTSYMIKQDKPLFLNSEQFDKLVSEGAIELIGENSIEWLGVPLKTSSNETIGALVVQTYNQAEGYKESDKDILEFVSNQIAMAISKQQSTERLVHSERMLSEMNATKDKFFSIIAHDLRSPFTAFLGFSEFLSENADDLSAAEIGDISGRMHKSAKVVYTLLENLLEWSSVQTGRIDFRPGVFNVDEIIFPVIDLVNDNAVKKEICIEVSIPNAAEIFADENMIRSVLRNLLSNAIKFTNQGGNIFVNVERTDSFVYISVRDTGIGMEQKVLENVFRIDQKTSTLGTQGERGSGLGLVLCKEFVEKNCGQIKVSSSPNEGSTFSFSLPLYIKAE